MITTATQALSGMQFPNEFVKSAGNTPNAGRPVTSFYQGGYPTAGAIPTAGLSGQTLSAPVVGQIPFTNPVSGNTYLARFQGQVSIGGTLLLCDRLWQNSGINISATTEQLFTGSQQIPPRDANGTNNGDEVFAAVEHSQTLASSTSSTPITYTIKYINEQGVTGRTGTNIFQNTTAAVNGGTFFIIGLQSGDKGIQRVQSITLNDLQVGTRLHVVLFRIIARLEIPLGATSNVLDMYTGGFPKLYNDSVPFLVHITSSSSFFTLSGQIIYSQG